MTETNPIAEHQARVVAERALLPAVPEGLAVVLSRDAWSTRPWWATCSRCGDLLVLTRDREALVDLASSAAAAHHCAVPWKPFGSR